MQVGGVTMKSPDAAARHGSRPEEGAFPAHFNAVTHQGSNNLQRCCNCHNGGNLGSTAAEVHVAEHLG